MSKRMDIEVGSGVSPTKFHQSVAQTNLDLLASEMMIRLQMSLDP